MDGGAEGEGGRTEGVSDLMGDCTWLPGDLGRGRTMAAEAIAIAEPFSLVGLNSETDLKAINVSKSVCGAKLA